MSGAVCTRQEARQASKSILGVEQKPLEIHSSPFILLRNF